MTFKYIAGSIIIILPSLAFSSGVDPQCKFSISENGYMMGAKYRITDAYKASDLVVVGRAAEYGRPQIVEVKKVIKGELSIGREINLIGRSCEGTACSGLSIPTGNDFLLFLRRLPNGQFHKVDGDGNDICPNVFEVKNGCAIVGEKKIKIDSVRSFFKQGLAPISLD